MELLLLVRCAVGHIFAERKCSHVQVVHFGDVACVLVLNAVPRHRLWAGDN